MTARPALADQAYAAIRDAILDRRFVPGVTLVENELATMLGVSRTPVREALSRLQLEGFVSRDEATGSLRVVRLTLAQIRDLFGIRILLERQAARLAAERISDTEIADLEALVERDRAALRRGDVTELATINQEFHDVILVAGRNRMLFELLQRLRTRLTGLMAFAVGTRDDRRRFVDEHAEMTRLLREGDANRVDALVQHHLEIARDLLLVGMQHPDKEQG